MFIWWLIKIPVSGNGHSSRIYKHVAFPKLSCVLHCCMHKGSKYKKLKETAGIIKAKCLDKICGICGIVDNASGCHLFVLFTQM